MEDFRMARHAQATRLGSGRVGSTVQELGSSLARQAEAASERLQALASQLRESLPSDTAALFGNGMKSAREYLGEREFTEMGRDALDLVRRYPVQTALVAAGVGWALSRFARRGATEGGFNTRLKDVMTRHVEVVRPDAPLKEAAAKMADLDVGAIPVCDGERLVGMLTDRDITVRGVARGADPSSTPVRDVMSGAVRFVFEDEPIGQAASVMKRNNIRRLPVLDPNKRLAGIVSLGDLAKDADVGEAGEVLEDVSSAPPTR
jgi:CBS domain-containing protein